MSIFNENPYDEDSLQYIGLGSIKKDPEPEINLCNEEITDLITQTCEISKRIIHGDSDEKIIGEFLSGKKSRYYKSEIKSNNGITIELSYSNFRNEKDMKLTIFVFSKGIVNSENYLKLTEEVSKIESEINNSLERKRRAKKDHAINIRAERWARKMGY